MKSGFMNHLSGLVVVRSVAWQHLVWITYKAAEPAQPAEFLLKESDLLGCECLELTMGWQGCHKPR